MYDKASGEQSSSVGCSGLAQQHAAGCQLQAESRRSTEGTALSGLPSDAAPTLQQLVIAVASESNGSRADAPAGPESRTDSAALTPVGDADVTPGFLSDAHLVGPELVYNHVDDSSVPNRDAFPLQKLPGEHLVRVSVDAAKKSKLALTCYRLVAVSAASASASTSTELVAIVPARSIDAAQQEDQFTLLVNLKDGRTLRHVFSSPAVCAEWVALLNDVSKPPENPRNDLAAYRFYTYMRYATDKQRCNAHQFSKPDNSSADCEESIVQLELACSYDFLGSGGWPRKDGVFSDELDRLGFSYKCKDDTWRITYANSDYKACPTYPPLHVVPTNVMDDVVKSSAGYRTNGRFPSVVWRSAQRGTVLMRASQPQVGMSLFSNKFAPADQQLVKGVLDAVQKDRQRLAAASLSPPPAPGRRQLLIFDCRDSLATGYNQLINGGGTERVGDYDSDGVFEYGYLPNVTKVLSSFGKLRARCAAALREATQPGVGTAPSALSAAAFADLEWLRTVGDLLANANRVASALVDEQISVLVHCSDGWDRTPQLIALTKLLVDPHYRTILGFVRLIERDFIDYGHKFAERCGHDSAGSRHAERAPIFVQFLDCVYQLLTQNPTEFEFTESLLLKLAYHVYSCLFGTFLANSRKERDENFSKSTLSVWVLLMEHTPCSDVPTDTDTDSDTETETKLVRPCWKYINAAYRPTTNFLRADTTNIQLWRSLYLNRAGRFNDGCTNMVAASQPPAPSPSVPFAARHLAAAGSAPSTDLRSNTRHSSEAGADTDSAVHPFDASANSTTLPCATNMAAHVQHASSPIPIDRFANGKCPSGMPRVGSSSSLSRSLSEGKMSLTLMSYEASPTSPRDFSFARRERDVARLRSPTRDSSSPRPVSPALPLVARNARPTGPCPLPVSATSYKPVVVNRLKRSRLRLILEELASGTCRPHVDADGLLLTVSRIDASLELVRLDVEALTEETRQLRSELREREERLAAAARTRGALPADLRVRDLNPAVGNSVDSSLMNMSLDDEPLEADAARPRASNGDRARHSDALINSTSWEEIDAGEAPLTRWVPNDAAPNCASCFTAFTLVTRKHHCRRCGCVFCASCTNYTVRLPELNLAREERVCKRCYLTVMRTKAEPRPQSRSLANALTSAPSLIYAAPVVSRPAVSAAVTPAPAAIPVCDAKQESRCNALFANSHCNANFIPFAGSMTAATVTGSVDSMCNAAGAALLTSCDTCLFGSASTVPRPTQSVAPLCSTSYSFHAPSSGKLSNGSGLLANGTSAAATCQLQETTIVAPSASGIGFIHTVQQAQAPIVVSAVDNRRNLSDGKMRNGDSIIGASIQTQLLSTSLSASHNSQSDVL